MKQDWYASYDLDGSWEIVQVPHLANPPTLYGHNLGPYPSFSRAKEALRVRLVACIEELRGGLQLLKDTKRSRYD